MTVYGFTIPGKPMPWQRTRHHGRQHYTPPETRLYQEHVRRCAVLARVQPIAGPVRMELHIYFPDNRVRDDDNVEKSIRDALQANARRRWRALAFENDHQVKKVVREVMPPDKAFPRVEVLIETFKGVTP